MKQNKISKTKINDNLIIDGSNVLCPGCHHVMTGDNEILLSNPAKRRYFCNNNECNIAYGTVYYAYDTPFLNRDDALEYFWKMKEIDNTIRY